MAPPSQAIPAALAGKENAVAEDSRALVGGGLALESSSAQVGSWVLAGKAGYKGCCALQAGGLPVLAVCPCLFSQSRLPAGPNSWPHPAARPFPAPCLRPA